MANAKFTETSMHPENVGREFVSEGAKQRVGAVYKVVDKGLVSGERTYELYVESLSQPVTFRFFDDEIWISPEEILGKTTEAASALRHQKDAAYLRSP